MLTSILIIIVLISFSLINHFVGLNYPIKKSNLSNNVAYALENLYNQCNNDLVFLIGQMDINNYSKEAYKKVLEAQELVKKDNHPSAITLYLEILKEYPKWLKVKEALIDSYFNIKHYKNVIKESAELLELDSNNVFALNSLYKAGLKMSNLELAIKYLNKIIEINAFDEDKLFELAELYYENGQFQNSLNTYIELSQKTDNIEASKKIFDIFKLLKNLPEQLAWCNKVLTREPRNVRFLMELTDIYIKTRNFDGALNTAIKLKENLEESSSDIDIKIASIYHNLDKSDYAKEIIIGILAKDSFNLEARKLLTKIYRDNKDFDKMLNEAKEVVYSTLKEEKLEDSKDFYTNILNDYACSLYEENKNPQALEIISLAQAEKETDRANALVSKINYKIKNTDEALLYINKAIELNPNNPEYYYILATIKLDKKLINEAKENYQKAVILNNDYKEAYFGLALAYVQETNYKKAIDNFKKCIAINKRDYKAYVNLGIVYEKIEDVKNAIAYFKVAEKLKNDAKIAKKIEILEKKI